MKKNVFVLFFVALLTLLLINGASASNDLFHVQSVDANAGGWKISSDGILQPLTNGGIYAKTEYITTGGTPNYLSPTIDSGIHIVDNKGLKHVLPRSVAGMYVTITVGGDVNVTVDTVDANDTILWSSDDTSLDAGDSLTVNNPQKGDSATFVGLGSNNWVAITHRGSWADNGTN